ncbi:MAG: CxxxxCH/CxxCH domain-containing protein [Ignavibacteria bacterium]|nr:CxxxxCH/CxxCH domain-containing protein [Ignavibacteria bacterium]
MKNYIKISLVALLAAVCFAGCANQKEDIPVQPGLTTHTSGIMSKTASDFHGKMLSDSNYQYSPQCARCHGADYKGGIAGVACSRCHREDYLHLRGSDNANKIKADLSYHQYLVKSVDAWSMTRCQRCHGTDYAGGKVNVSCLTCHKGTNGPEACNTCHGTDASGAPPRALTGDTIITTRGVGLHQIHLKNTTFSSTPVACAQCHTPVTTVAQAGHIDNTAGAEVIFGALAKTATNAPSSTNVWITYDAAQGAITPNPVYDPIAVNCSNTYCHGNFKNGRKATVSWIQKGIKCGSCHGDGNDNPVPQDKFHAGKTDCQPCHDGFSKSGSGYVVNKAKHLDGKVTIFGNDYTF